MLVRRELIHLSSHVGDPARDRGRSSFSLVSLVSLASGFFCFASRSLSRKRLNSPTRQVDNSPNTFLRWMIFHFSDSVLLMTNDQCRKLTHLARLQVVGLNRPCALCSSILAAPRRLLPDLAGTALPLVPAYVPMSHCPIVPLSRCPIFLLSLCPNKNSHEVIARARAVTHSKRRAIVILNTCHPIRFGGQFLQKI